MELHWEIEIILVVVALGVNHFLNDILTFIYFIYCSLQINTIFVTNTGIGVVSGKTEHSFNICHKVSNRYPFIEGKVSLITMNHVVSFEQQQFWEVMVKFSVI